MTQEDKLKQAKELYKTANEDQKYVLEKLFPELSESEDERIRKWIIKQIKTYDPSNIREEALAWLEKQGEQKIDWSEEDDYNLQCIVAKVVSDIQKGTIGRNQELIVWLKSLKQRIGK